RNSEQAILDIPVDITNNTVSPVAGGPAASTGTAATPPTAGGSTFAANPATARRRPLKDLVTARGPDVPNGPGQGFLRSGASTIYREQGKRLIAVKFSVR